MGILLPVTLALLPLLILPSVVFYYDITPKLAVLLFGAGLALFWFEQNRRALISLWTGKSGRWIILILGAQLCSLLLSTLGSQNPWFSVGGSTWRRFGLLSQGALILFTLLAAAQFSTNRVILRRALQAIALSGCVMALYGMAQYLGWDPLLPPTSYLAGEGIFQIVRPPATLGHAGYFATYLLFTLAAALATFPFNRKLACCSVVLMPVAIVLSGTRAALLGLAVGAVCLVLLRRPSLRTISIASACAAAVLVLLLISPAGGKLRARVKWSADDAKGGARILLWRDTLHLAEAHALLGSGLDTFGTAFPRYQSVELSRAYPDFYHESPHNILLDTLSSQGVFGLLILLALLALGFQHAKGNPELAAGLAAVFVSLQFTSFTIATSLGFLILIATLLPPVSLHESKPKNNSWKIVPAVLAVCLIFAGMRVMLADFTFQQAKTALDAGRISDAMGEYLAAGALANLGGRPDLYFSRRFTAARRRPEALTAGVQAAAGPEDRPNGLYNLAALHSASNDAAAVEADLRAAIDASPQWFKPHWTLARLLAGQGRRNEANREADRAVELDGGKHPEVTLARDRIRLGLKPY
ncbi:O-antigen ligase family protein [Paludibaculum fermentans]|uniref:O-antigen ligase family protein n=1 Tax=Paludibaculum fermentans TaxID=1473598 RepID=A0A7S7NRF5_PALFE|nr:O-antigen ligase family protein [Paludibaculum fermentans]QOY88460.1 O-antigen ligase family protein [Paludibaculum fermentans]